MNNVYLDVCCYNRPFDDQTDSKIRLESDAVLSIISLCENNMITIYGSDVIDYEICNCANMEKRNKVLILSSICLYKIKLNISIINRAAFLEKNGIDSIDALHLAAAESKCGILFTTDFNFIKKANTIENLNIRVLNPAYWVISGGK